MAGIRVGELRVCTPEQVYIFPASDVQDNRRPNLKAELQVLSDTFWLRLCTAGDLGFAEAYMFGDVACDDLISLFQVTHFSIALVNF
jgi:cyclopropane-fatty-acyl-phospholipid synthase